MLLIKGDIDRRHRSDLQTPAEVAIAKAVDAVSTYGADPLLGEAVKLLYAARAKVADYVDHQLRAG